MKNVPEKLYIIIFIILCFVLNINSQNLNYYLNKGTSLEYSYTGEEKADAEELIQDKLSKLNIKYNRVDNADIENQEYYDTDEVRVKNSLIINIPIKITQKNKDLFNEISDFVFENFENAKLIDLRSINSDYHQPYATLFYYLQVALLAFIIWLLPYFALKKAGLIKKEKTEEENENKDGGLKDFIQKTKEKGFKYFLKRLFFDEDTAEGKTNLAWEILSTIVFVLVCVIVIRYFIGELRWIPSGSMRPTIVEKDRVFVEKLDYPKREIKRGDILVFYPPEVKLSNSPLALLSRLSGIFCKDIAYIKRVVGLPNDKLEIKYNKEIGEYRVFINDKPLNEPYVSNKNSWTPCKEGMFCGPFVIPKDSYFMMGDNRNNSQDSRFWGFLDKNRIIGRANFMFFPFGRINVLKDKYFTLKKNKTLEETYILNRY